ncbi:unnamed protein product [Bursaphelenchus xylophilus]|nr:unnamed protein product [Bursaphelenchus xylophilus]CAG9106262.1 unnamed protein product [Bursaphelenchus xylophilus]
MADDEQYSEEEEYEEEEEVEAEEVPKPAESKPAPPPAAHDEDVDESQLTEAERAMLEAKRRQKDEDESKLQDYEERRKSEREREEEELRLLKEKQEQRRIQREQEEKEQAEKRQQEEERRKQEEEERKARIEEERKKKEEEKRKKQMLSAGFAMPQGTGPNYVLPEKKEKGDKFGNIVQAKQEMGMTKEQQEDQKMAFIKQMENSITFDGLSGAELKAKVKELHQRICKLETDKYDLEKRHERQEYDLKELNERQRQVARNRALKKGLDPSDTANSRYPPKVSISSKYDRQIDRRNFKERRAVFDKNNAYPCFPNVPPPPVILEFKLQQGSQAGDGDGEQNMEEVEEEYEEE